MNAKLLVCYHKIVHLIVLSSLFADLWIISNYEEYRVAVYDLVIWYIDVHVSRHSTIRFSSGKLIYCEDKKTGELLLLVITLCTVHSISLI